MKIWGRIRFYSASDKLLEDLHYGNGVYRDKIINDFAKTASEGCYYHILPNFSYRTTNRFIPDQIRTKIVRPPAIYDNANCLEY